MSEQEQHPDPPIYKHLSPKTQGFLRASASQREEAARLNEATMSNEQTYVAPPFSCAWKPAVKLIIWTASLLSSLMASRYAKISIE
jgi:hypothetical protein